MRHPSMMEASRPASNRSRSALLVAAALHFGVGCGTEGGKLAMPSSNAPPVAPPVPVHAPKNRGDWVVEHWALLRTETHLEGMRKGEVDVRPALSFSRRFTRTEEASGLCRVEVTRERPEPGPPEAADLSPRSAPNPETAQRDEWRFARSVDAFPVFGNEAIIALGRRLLRLDDALAWRIEPGREEGVFRLRYEPAPPTKTTPLDKTVHSRFEGSLVLTEGLPRSLEGTETSLVSQAAFSGEMQVWEVLDKIEVTWQYGSAP